MLTKDYYTLKEVAEILNLSYGVVRNYVYQDKYKDSLKIKTVKKFDTVLVTKTELNRQIEKRK